MLFIISDCLIVVNWFRNVDCAPSPFKELIEACRSLFIAFKWKVAHIGREFNSTADLLAKKGLRQRVASGIAVDPG